MRIVPLFSRKWSSVDWVGEIDTWFREFDQWRISGILHKLMEMLKLPGMSNDRDAGDLIYRKLRNQRKESNNALVKGEPYVAIAKKCLFGFLRRHSSRSKGIRLTEVKNQIRDLDKVSPAELGKANGTPEGLLGWLLEKNEVLVGAKLGLTDYEVVESFRNCNIADTSQLRDGVVRKKLTTEFANKLAREEPDLMFREDPHRIWQKFTDRF